MSDSMWEPREPIRAGTGNTYRCRNCGHDEWLAAFLWDEVAPNGATLVVYECTKCDSVVTSADIHWDRMAESSW